MITIGVTGSIGTGKSYISSCFKRLGYPVFDADDYVHQLMKKNQQVIEEIREIFPDAVVNNQVKRENLRPFVKGNPKELKKLEAILHPKVREAEKRFLQKCRMMRCKVAVLDIPLLFETGADILCDYVLVTYVNQRIQQSRVLKRGKMSQEFLDYIKQLQMQQDSKMAMADMVIDTSRSKSYNFKKVKAIVTSLIPSMKST